MNRVTSAVALLLMLSSGAALAAHGKAGLWNTSTVMNMAMVIPPQMPAQMKKSGMTMPATQTIVSQLCMTEAEVNADRPPQMGGADPGCQTHIVSQTPSGMAADMICNGKLKGTGHMEVSYTSPEHYSGRYAFHGSVAGHPSNLATTFKGDWVKSDCGAVKPYTAKK